jgi:hypothetical protein
MYTILAVKENPETAGKPNRGEEHKPAFGRLVRQRKLRSSGGRKSDNAEKLFQRRTSGYLVAADNLRLANSRNGALDQPREWSNPFSFSTGSIEYPEHLRPSRYDRYSRIQRLWPKEGRRAGTFCVYDEPAERSSSFDK